MAKNKTIDNTAILSGKDFVQATIAYCDQYNVDAVAAISVAASYGIGGTIGNNGYGYGPWWINLDAPDLAALAPIKPYDPLLNAWAWSDNGIQYAVRLMWRGEAANATGFPAVELIEVVLHGIEALNANYEQLEAQFNRIIGLEGKALSHVATIAAGASPLGVVEQSQSDPKSTGNAQPTAWQDWMNTFGVTMPSFAGDMAARGAKLIQVVKS